MRLTLVEWIARTATLVLAGLITLSIIGAIASIPSGSIETRIGIGGTEPPSSSAPPSEPASPAQDGAGSREGVTAPTGGVAPSPAGDRADAARWLEAITYALVALAGIAALALILLWRGVRAVERLEDRRVGPGGAMPRRS